MELLETLAKRVRLAFLVCLDKLAKMVCLGSLAKKGCLDMEPLVSLD